jgi:hypothetical protein
MTSVRLVAVVLVACIACSSRSSGTRGIGTGSGSGSDAGAAAALRIEEDKGVFVTTQGDGATSRETFSVVRVGDHRVLRSEVVDAGDPAKVQAAGELEVDAAYRPVRAEFARLGPDGRTTYRLKDGVLDIEGDGGDDPQKLTAVGPVDVYVEGPGFLPMTALCRVRGESALGTVGARDSAFEDFVLAYEGTKVGELRRIVVYAAGFDLELACDGDRLVAAALPAVDMWTVREGREDDLAALRAAPRPAERKWVFPVVESAPWEPYHTWIVDGNVAINRDARKSQTRLTAYDLATGAELAHRDFAVRMGVLCEPGRGTILCEIEEGSLWILDARSLEDLADADGVVKGIAPDSDPAQWEVLDGTRIAIDDTRAVQIDVAKRDAKLVKRKKDERRAVDRTACWSPLGQPVIVGKAEWKVDRMNGKSTLERTVGGVVQVDVEGGLSLDDLYEPYLQACGPKRDQPILVSNNSDKAEHYLVAANADARMKWKSENLGGHLREMWLVDGRLIVPTDNQKRRIIALDAATGAVVWTAVGPLPK